jgi:hypothetical protein
MANRERNRDRELARIRKKWERVNKARAERGEEPFSEFEILRQYYEEERKLLIDNNNEPSRQEDMEPFSVFETKEDYLKWHERNFESPPPASVIDAPHTPGRPFMTFQTDRDFEEWELRTYATGLQYYDDIPEDDTPEQEHEKDNEPELPNQDTKEELPSQETEEELPNRVAIEGPPEPELQPEPDALPSPHGRIATGDQERQHSTPIVAPSRDPDGRDRNDLGGDESPATEIEEEQHHPTDSLSPVTQVDRSEQDFTPQPGGGNEPGELADPEEQRKMIRYLAEERPWMREQMQKDQERDAKQFDENAMQQDAEEIERQRAGQSPNRDDAGEILRRNRAERTDAGQKPEPEQEQPYNRDDAGEVLRRNRAEREARNLEQDRDLDQDPDLDHDR